MISLQQHFWNNACGVTFVCEVNGGNACMVCRVWYVACHVFNIYIMFLIFMPCFIYLCVIYTLSPWFIYIYALFYIYSCHVLYIYPMFYIFIPCFIYLCHFQYIMHHYSSMLHQDFHFCCIVFSHLCCIHTNLCCINTTKLCCIKFCQQFHFFHYPLQWEVIITCSRLWS